MCSFYAPPSSLFQKRQLSAQSLAFNLKDKVFCELFPEVVDVRTVEFQHWSFSPLPFSPFHPLILLCFLGLSWGRR